MACHNMKLNFTVRYHKETTKKHKNLSIIRLARFFSLSFISNSISKCHLSNLVPIFVHFDLFNTCVYVSGFFLTRGGGNCYQIGKYKNEFRLDPWPVLLNETVKNTFESCEWHRTNFFLIPLKFQGYYQVWPLTQFFLLPFCEKKSSTCLEGESMTPHRGNTILCSSSQQLARLRIGPLTPLVLCFRNSRDTKTPSGVAS